LTEIGSNRLARLPLSLLIEKMGLIPTEVKEMGSAAFAESAEVQYK